MTDYASSKLKISVRSNGNLAIWGTKSQTTRIGFVVGKWLHTVMPGNRIVYWQDGEGNGSQLCRTEKINEYRYTMAQGGVFVKRKPHVVQCTALDDAVVLAELNPTFLELKTGHRLQEQLPLPLFVQEALNAHAVHRDRIAKIKDVVPTDDDRPERPSRKGETSSSIEAAFAIQAILDKLTPYDQGEVMGVFFRKMNLR